MLYPLSYEDYKPTRRLELRTSALRERRSIQLKLSWQMLPEGLEPSTVWI